MSDDISSELVRLGLTEYQARTYRALIESGRSTAGDLARRTGIPRNRVYDSLEELANHGLVEVVLDEPRSYAPLAFEAYLERRIREFEENATALKRTRDRIAELMLASAGTEAASSTGALRVLRGSAAAEAAFVELVEKASTSVHVTLPSQLAQRILGHGGKRSALESARARGVDVRIVAAVSPESSKYLEDASLALGPSLRAARDSVLHLGRLVVDARTLYLRAPGTDEPGRGEVGYVTESSVLVADAEDYVEGAWAASSPVAERIREITTGVPGEWERATRDLAVGVSDMVAAVDLARREILILAESMDALPGEPGERILASLSRARARGVNVRLLARLDKPALERISTVGIHEVRHIGNPDFDCLIVDDDHLVELVSIGRDGAGLIVTSTLRAKVQGFRALFEERWRLGVPLADRIQQLESGIEGPLVQFYGGGDEDLSAWRALFGVASRSLDCVSDATQFEEYGLDWIAALSARIERGMRIRLIVANGRLSPALAAAYAKAGIDYRYTGAALAQNHVILDEKAMLLALYAPPSAGARARPVFRVTTQDPTVVKHVAARFDALWSVSDRTPPSS